MRILILDSDKSPKSIKNSFDRLLEVDNSEISKIPLPKEDSEEKYLFNRISYEDLGLEVLVCPCPFAAQKFLIKDTEHFDIIFVNINLTSHSIHKGEEEAPKLAGLLFAMAFIDRSQTFVRIYTTNHSRMMRTSVDYDYFKSIIAGWSNNLLGGQLKFISLRLEYCVRYFYAEISSCIFSKNNDNTWVEQVLLKKITLDSYLSIAKFSYPDSQDPKNVTLDHGMGRSSEIKIELIYKLIEKENQYIFAAKTLGKNCGHATVRYIFANLVHERDLEKCLEKFKSKEILDIFKHISSCFDISDIEEAIEYISTATSKEEYQKCYRFDICELFKSQDNNQQSYIYCLWQNSEQRELFLSELKQNITSILIKNNDENQYFNPDVRSTTIDGQNLTIDRFDGKKIVITGNRQDTMYLEQLAEGGSCTDIINKLKNIVTDLELVGSNGSRKLIPSGGIVDQNRKNYTVQLIITLRNLPKEHN